MKENIIFGKQTLFTSSSENMHHLRDKSINVVITSPPYNVGKVYDMGKDQLAEKTGYNDKKTSSEYLSFLKRVFAECYRVLSEDGVFFLNIGDSARDQGKSEDVVNSAVEVGFKRLQSVIWVKSIFGKGHYTPSGGNRRLNNVWEYVYILFKSKKYKIDPKAIGIPYADKSNIGRYSEIDLRDAGDVWFVPYTKTTGASIKKGHEAPFPIELAYRCLKLVPNAKTVLDPFAGTASTLRAAEELNLFGFGYEILPRLNVIEQRMQEPMNIDQSPLIPQLEFYSEMMTQMIDEFLKEISKKEIEKRINKLRSNDKKKFIWACKDLKKHPSILNYFTKDFQQLTKESLKNRGNMDKTKKLDDYIKTESKG
ncbi:MAG: DNA-methyltransferase [Candidatus Hodarchaeales archaeon]